MWEYFFGNKEEKKAVAAEQRHMDYGRQQTVLAAESHPSHDLTFKQQQKERSDLLMWQQNLEDELLNIVMTLKGFALDEKGKPIKVNKALCNDKFIYQVVIPQCKPLLSRNLINSNFQEQRILTILKSTMNTIASTMAANHGLYGIDEADLDTVITVIKNMVTPAPYRAYLGWTKKIDSTMMKMLESVQRKEGESQKKKLFSIFDT